MEKKFIKEQISTKIKISNRVLNDLKLRIGTEDDDFILNQMTAQLIGYVYSNMVEERELIYYCERPKFIDWLFRKRKKVIFDLKVKDLLLNEQKNNNTIRIYIINNKR